MRTSSVLLALIATGILVGGTAITSYAGQGGHHHRGHHLSGGDIGYNWQPGGDQYHVTQIPEPATMALVASGLVGAAALRRRKKKGPDA